MLRLAEPKDFEVVKEMANRFFEASPYKDYPRDEKIFDTYIKSFLEPGEPSKVCVLSYEEDKSAEPILVGLIAFEVGSWLFSPVKAGVEKALWIDPEYRKSQHAKDLIGAFEYWGKENKCELLQLSSLEGEYVEMLNKFYTKMGYQRVENHFLKKL